MSLKEPGAPSLYLGDLAEYSSLAFVAAFDFQPPLIPNLANQKPPPMRRVSYIAVAKSVMPLLSDSYIRYKAEDAIYTDRTMEKIISVGTRTRSIDPALSQ